MGTEQQLTRWAERFNVLLYRPIPHNPHNSLPSEADLSINCGQATRQDIKQASGQMKSGKAAGQDGIPTEAMKADIYASVEMFILYFGKIWEEEEIPDDWKEGYLVKLPKKGRPQ